MLNWHGALCSYLNILLDNFIFCCIIVGLSVPICHAKVYSFTINCVMPLVKLVIFCIFFVPLFTYLQVFVSFEQAMPSVLIL